MITTKEYLGIYKDNEDKRREYNSQILKKYPWLEVTNSWTGEPIGTLDFTWLDDIPYGWRLTFGDQMIEELDNLLKKYNFEKEYQIVQIKEKFGELRWYDAGFPKDAYEEYCNWLNKYTELSAKTCITCGKDSIGFTRGWILPLCKDCMGDRIYDPI